MAITFRQLQHFLALSEELHFGNAARKLHISQPPLSASLRQLEQELGYDLMERTRKSVRLTPAGAVFADQARRILDQLNAAQTMARQVAFGAAGAISVGFVSSMLFRDLPAMLRRFEEACPEIRLSLREMNTGRQVADLLAHELDVGFVHAVPAQEQLDEYPLDSERLVCCVHRNHRLAGKSRIRISELAGEKVILFSREFSSHFHDRIAALLSTSNVEPHDGYAVQHWFTVVALVSQGLGVSLVPRSLARSGFDEVAYVEIAEPKAEHTVSMLWHGEARNEATQTFVEFVKTFGSASLTG